MEGQAYSGAALWNGMGTPILIQKAYGIDKVGGIDQLTTPPQRTRMSYSGDRYLVVCNGAVHELPAAATLEQATEKAEALAHQHSAQAYILKPVRKVAPKRDVVTTDL